MRLALKVWTITITYAAMMYQGSGVPVTMRKQPRDTPMATPMATAMRNPQERTVPPDTSSAFRATAMRDGSAMVVAKPMAPAKA